MLELAQKYAALKYTTILAHKIVGKEITFVLASGPKLTMTESQLKTAIAKLSGDGVGDEEQTPAAASSADKPRAKTKKEGN